MSFFSLVTLIMQMVMLDCITGCRVIDILSAGTRSDGNSEKSEYLTPRSAVDHCNLLNHFLKTHFSQTLHDLISFHACDLFCNSGFNSCLVFQNKIQVRGVKESYFLTNDPPVWWPSQTKLQCGCVYNILLSVQRHIFHITVSSYWWRIKVPPLIKDLCSVCTV